VVAVAPPLARLTEADIAEALSSLGDEAPRADEFERAYVRLHAAVEAAYVSAFKAVGRGRGPGYSPGYTRDAQARSRTLMAAPIVLNFVVALEDRSAALAVDLANARELAQSLAGRWPTRSIGLFFLGQSVQRASELLDDAAGPFSGPFADYRRTTVGSLDQLRAGRRQLPSAAADSPLVWLHVGACYLLAVPLALQCVLAALSARRLYEIDGNVGVRAAVTKLGSRLVSSTGEDADLDDLLGIRALVGSLEGYTTRLWRSLGVDFRAAREQQVRPFATAAARLVDAELREPVPAGLKPDRLETWGESESVNTLAVATHLPTTSTGSRLPFVPTWPQIANRPQYTKVAKPIVMHDEPGAQLGLLVASSLYRRAGEFVVEAGAQPRVLRPPTVTAACLEYGGAHPPHATHRSGAELDLDLDLRDLDRFREFLPRGLAGAGFPVDPLQPDAEFVVDFQKSAFHRRWAELLEQAIRAREIAPGREPFRTFKLPPFDHYGTFDPANVEGADNFSPRDSAEEVAQARAFCLALLLSGASRILFADPWVFIDAFRRQEIAFRDLAASAESQGVRIPAPFGSRATTRGILEPYAHFNHWHAEWKHLPTGMRTRVAGPDLAVWTPVWKALGIALADLDGLLTAIGGSSNSTIARSCDALRARLSRLWRQVDVRGLDDFFRLIFDGTEEDDRALLRDTAHTGSNEQ
jgi:hypothetical protein